MTLIDRKMKLVRIVLSKLEKQPRRWTELLKLTLIDCGTPDTFKSIITFLLKHNYVERPERGLYQITQKGRDFLKTL